MIMLKKLILINKLLNNAKTEKFRHYLLSRAEELRNGKS
jgi:hypothetical protein